MNTRSMFSFLTTICVAASVSFSIASDATNLLQDPGFEQGEKFWSWDKTLMRQTPLAARSGNMGVRILDNSAIDGSSLTSQQIPIHAEKYYLASCYVRLLEQKKSGAGLYVQFFDSKGESIKKSSASGEWIFSFSNLKKGKWAQKRFAVQAPKNAAFLRIWVHSFTSSLAAIDLDDLCVCEISKSKAKEVTEKSIVRELPYLSPKRIDEIAAMLPAAPSAPGDRITVRNHWDELAKLPEAQAKIRNAEKALKTPIPDLPDDLYLDFTRNGNRTRYQKPYFLRQNQLGTLLIAECLENKGRFLPKIAELIDAICSERSWTLPAHDSQLTNFNKTHLTIDLGSSLQGCLLAITADWLKEKLPTESIKKINTELRWRIFDVYEKALDTRTCGGNWWMRTISNWNAVCHAGVVGAALATIPDPKVRARYIASVEKMNSYFISGFTDDGYCGEGMGYWNYGFGNDIILGLTIRNATKGKVDLFRGDKIHRVAAYAQNFQLQSAKAPWFADGGGAPDELIWTLARQVWPDTVPDRVANLSLLAGNCRFIGLRAFGQDPGRIENPRPENLPIRSWFKDAQVLICRPVDQTPKPFSFSIKGGHNNELHNHNDVGSYTIMLDGLEMTGDPGGEIYTRRTFSKDRYASKMLNSYGHPVPVVAGKLQPAGRKFHASILKEEFSDGEDLIRLDLTHAYDVPTLKRLTRTVRYLRAEREVEISDEVEFTAPEQFSVPVITYRQIKKTENPAEFRLQNKDGKCSLLLRVETQSHTLETSEETIENPGRPSPARFAFTFQKPILEGEITLKFKAE